MQKKKIKAGSNINNRNNNHNNSNSASSRVNKAKSKNNHVDNVYISFRKLNKNQWEVILKSELFKLFLMIKGRNGVYLLKGDEDFQRIRTIYVNHALDPVETEQQRSTLQLIQRYCNVFPDGEFDLW